jgi:hypothetical protein
MSTGCKYFLAKYKLARDQLANASSEPCTCAVKAHERLMAAPYKTRAATKAAEKELTGLRDVTEKDVDSAEEYLKKRREELKKEEELRQNIANGANNGNIRQSPTRLILNVRGKSPLQRSQSPGTGPASSATQTNGANGANNGNNRQSPTRANIILCNPNSPFRRSQSPGSGPVAPATGSNDNSGVSDSIPATSRPSQTGQTPNRGSRLHLKVRGLGLTPAWEIPQLVPQTPTSASAPVEQPKPTRKRKNEGLFDLESAAKRPHLGFCKPMPVHNPGPRPFIADDYNYQEVRAALKSKNIIVPDEIPVERATTRRMTTAGAKLHKPEGDNFSREGGLRKTLPQNRGLKLFLLTKKEVKSDYDEIASRKKEEAIFQALREEIKAFARRHDSEECPNEIYTNMKAKQAKRRAQKERNRQHRRHVQTVYSEVKPVLTEAKEEFKEKYFAMMRERNTNGYTPALDTFIDDAFEADATYNRNKAAYFELLKTLREASAEEAFNGLTKIKDETELKEAKIAELTATLEQKIGTYGQTLNLPGDVAKLAAAEVVKANKALETEQKCFKAWTNSLGDDPEYEQQANDNDKMVMDPKEPEKKVRSGTATGYIIAEKCALLAKETVEAKEKLITMAREIDSIEPAENRFRLSAIPARIRMLPALNLKKGKPCGEFVYRTNADTQRINTTPRKPSNLRYELGACLAEKAVAEAAKAVEEVARIVQEQAEEEEAQRRQVEREERRRRKRAEILEYRRNLAKRRAEEYLETGIKPHIPHPDEKVDFDTALKMYLESEEGMRLLEGQAEAERRVREQATESQVAAGGQKMERVHTDEGYSSRPMESVESGCEKMIDEDEMDGVEFENESIRNFIAAMRHR